MNERTAMKERPRFPIEAAVVFAIFLLLATLLTAYKVIRIDQMHGDTAQQFSATESIASHGVGWSNVTASVLDFMFVKRYPGYTADSYQTAPLSPTRPAVVNLLGFHSYYILYPIALFTKILPTSVVLLGVDSFSLVGLVGLAYFVLRKLGIPIIGAALFCVLVMSHPGWGLGAIWGQFYPDRIYMLVGFLFMYFASQGREARNGLIASAVLCALVDERAALVSGLFLLAYVVLFWKSNTDRYLKLGLAVVLLCYGEFLVKFVLTNPEYSTFLPGSLAQVVAEFQRPVFVQDTLMFLLVNSPLLLLALFRWRWAVLAFFMMIPNIVGSIGGAEKVGWSTHYHASYFPALVLAAIFGTVALWRRLPAPRRKPLTYGALVVCMTFLAMTNQVATANPLLGASNVANSFIVAFPALAATWISPTGESVLRAGDEIRVLVPQGSTVTTIENGMPLLYHDRDIQWFPVDIDHADYAVVSIEGTDATGVPRFGGVINYLGADDSAKANATIQARMRKDGYDFARAKLFPQVDLAVIRRSGSRFARFAAAGPKKVGPAERPTASPAIYPSPGRPARIVQHSIVTGPSGTAKPTDIAGTFHTKPTAGDVLIAFASTGFGCIVAPGWQLAGTDRSTSMAVAYRIARADDDLDYVPFTTPTANGYSLILLDLSGDPRVIASPQAGGGFASGMTVAVSPSLAIPQIGGILLQLYGGNGAAPENVPQGYSDMLPRGQVQTLVAHAPPRGNASELVAQAVTSEPKAAVQPFVAKQTMHFAASESPGNLVAGWLVWIGGTAK
jgi:hypothetical protein